MNYKKRMLFIFIAFSILSAGYTYSQSFGVGLGVMRNNSPSEISNSLYSFYPQVSLSGGFFSERLGWEMSVGILYDMLESNELKERGYYDNTDYIFAPKLLFDIPGYIGYDMLPWFCAGFSFHMIHSDPVFPNKVSPLDSPSFPELDNHRIYLDLGIEKYIWKIYGFRLGLRYISSIPFSENKYEPSMPSLVDDFLHNQVKHSLQLIVKI